MRKFLNCTIPTVIAALFTFMHAVAQDPPKTNFGGGLVAGYNTNCGLGGHLFWRMHRTTQVDLAAGYTFYNGAKFALGGKVMPFQLENYENLEPFFSAYFSYSTGTKIERSGRYELPEAYRTFPIQSIVGGFGLNIAGEQVNHSISAGWNYVLDDPEVEVIQLPPTKTQTLEKINRSIDGGFMVMYTLSVYIPERRK